MNLSGRACALARLLIIVLVLLLGATIGAPLAAAQDERPVARRFPPPPPRASKWGMGVYRAGGGVLDVLQKTRPGVILLLDPDLEWARSVRRALPDAFIVGRLYVPDAQQALDNPTARGVAFADRVAQHAVPLKGIVDAWMSYNEVVGHDNFEQYRAYNEFQVAFARRLQDTHGVAAIAGNDGSGSVEPHDYPRYFAEAIRESAYFGIHAYSPLASRSLRTEAGWHILRYRKIHDALEQAGLHDVPMVITESGLGDGWRGFSSHEALASDFAWFTDELHRDAYLIGHAAFGLFQEGQWANFDLTNTVVLDRLATFQATQRPATRSIAAVPEPEPRATTRPSTTPLALLITPTPDPRARPADVHAYVPETYLPGPATPAPATPAPPAPVVPTPVPTTTLATAVPTPARTPALVATPAARPTVRPAVTTAPPSRQTPAGAPIAPPRSQPTLLPAVSPVAVAPPGPTSVPAAVDLAKAPAPPVSQPEVAAPSPAPTRQVVPTPGPRWPSILGAREPGVLAPPVAELAEVPTMLPDFLHTLLRLSLALAGAAAVWLVLRGRS